MSDKPIAVLVTALVAAPLCVVCILGPAVIGGFLAGWFGWLSDIGPVPAAAFAIIGAILVYGLARWTRARKTGGLEARDRTLTDGTDSLSPRKS